MRLFLRIAVWIFASAPLAGSLAAQPLLRSVLVIDEADPVRPAYFPLNSTFRSTLNEGSTTRVAVYAENLDLSRFDSPQDDAIVGTYLREKYREKSIDLIVVNGSRALELVLRLRATLWSGVPVVFSTIDEAAAARLKLPSDVTGTVLRRTLADALTTARALVPQLKRIALVGDPPERQRFQRPYLEEFPAFAAELELIDLTGLPISDLIARVSALPPDTAIIYEGIWSGETAADNTSEVALASVAAVANRPIVVDTEVWFGFGAAGGFLSRPALSGEVAAQLAVRILNGESAANIPVAIGDVNRPVFDWRQLKRFGVSDARLPPASEVRYREPSAWEQYRWQVMLVAAALLFQTALIVRLFYEHRRRRTAEIAARGAIHELTHLDRVATAGELSAAIAHEVSQPLTAIVVSASAALRFLARAAPDLDETRAALKTIVSEGHRAGDVIGSVRAMFKKDSDEKVPLDLNRLLQDVLGHVRGELQAQGIVVKIGLSRPLPLVLGHSGELQQVIFNLVRNAADAMRSVSDRPRVLRVGSAFDDSDGVLMSIEDSGTGIDPKDFNRIFESFFTTKSQGMGMGLSICRSIIEAHGGRLSASPGRPHGSVFRIILPAGKSSNR